MIKLNDLVKVIGNDYDPEDPDDLEMLNIFVGDKARVTRIINENRVEITFLDEETQRVAVSERVNEVFLDEIEVI